MSSTFRENDQNPKIRNVTTIRHEVGNKRGQVMNIWIGNVFEEYGRGAHTGRGGSGEPGNWDEGVVHQAPQRKEIHDEIPPTQKTYKNAHRWYQ